MNYAAFFLNSKASVVQLELLEVSHADFSKTYRIVRNAVDGVTVTLETGSTATFEYYPLKIEASTTLDDLDYSIKVHLGDLGEVIPAEIDRLQDAGSMLVKPTVVYRAYRSDDLSTPLVGPIQLEIASISLTKEGSSFEAKAPSLSLSKTGEVYSLERFPMLRGLL